MTPKGSKDFLHQQDTAPKNGGTPLWQEAKEGIWYDLVAGKDLNTYHTPRLLHGPIESLVLQVTHPSKHLFANSKFDVCSLLMV